MRAQEVVGGQEQVLVVDRGIVRDQMGRGIEDVQPALAGQLLRCLDDADGGDGLSVLRRSRPAGSSKL